jgi:hypothetical protein
MAQPNQLGGVNQGGVIGPPPLSILFPLGTPIHNKLDFNAYQEVSMERRSVQGEKISSCQFENG